MIAAMFFTVFAQVASSALPSADLSGTWVMDPARSSASTAQPTLVIEQQGAALRVTRQEAGQSGVVLDATLDGPVNATWRGPIPFSITKAEWRGNRLVLSGTSSPPSGAVLDATRTIELAGPDELRIDEVMSTGTTRFSRSEVYVRR